jgi:hypothetical protein
MTYEAGFTPGVLVKVHVNRVCGTGQAEAEAEDTIATEERCLFWIACPTASPTTASPTTVSPTFTPTTARPTTTKKPTKKPVPTKRPTKTPTSKRPTSKRPTKAPK